MIEYTFSVKLGWSQPLYKSDFYALPKSSDNLSYGAIPSHEEATYSINVITVTSTKLFAVKRNQSFKLKAS